jgi:sec-independent protein translocase protein TatB
MFDIGWSELLVIAVVAIVVVGPKDLPKLMRTFGFYAGKLRRAAADFQRQFNEAMAESEAEEVRKNIESIRSSMSTVDLKAPVDQPVMMPSEGQAAVGPAIAPPPAAPKPKGKPTTRKPASQKTKTAPTRRKTKAEPKT